MAVDPQQPQDSDSLAPLFESVGKLENKFIQRLSDAIKIPSISEQAERREDVFEMSRWLVKEMECLGIKTTLKHLGKQDNTEIDLPPVIIGHYVSSPDLPTILVYSHYDVQPASLADGWDTDPFELTHLPDGRMCGRGTSDDKGPLLIWLNMIEAFQLADIPVPANLVFCFEGMEESGSQGLADVVKEEANKAFANVDAVCITDTAWSSTQRPNVLRGLRGIMYYNIFVDGAQGDAHSGAFGGAISEPMTDMVNLMASLVDSNGRILVPGVYDDVLAVSEAERIALNEMEFSEDSLRAGIGAQLLHDDLADTLISKSRKPALSIHGIERAAAGKGASTIIVGNVAATFSIRTVPNMSNPKIDELIQTHLNKKFSELKSKNKLTIKLSGQGDWFFEEIDHWNYQSAIEATKTTWGVTPDIASEGGSIPIALDFKRILNKNVLLLPVGRSDDRCHSENEKLDRINYINAVKTYGAYLAAAKKHWKATISH